MSRNPAVILYNAAGYPISVLDGEVMAIGTQPGLMVSGYDRTNNRARFLNLDLNGYLIVTSPGTAAEQVPGFATGIITLNAIVTTPVRKTTYNEPASGAQRSIGSSSASDTAAGTGARTVIIEYLNSTFDGPFMEIVTLNGVTPVNTVATNIRVVERITVRTAGSTLSNVGTITMYNGLGGAGGTLGTMAATDNRTYWAHHYTPLAKTSFITGISVGAATNGSGQGSSYIIRSQDLSLANAADVPSSDVVSLYGQANGFSRTYDTALRIFGPARSVVWITTQDSNSLTYRASIDYYDQDT